MAFYPSTQRSNASRNYQDWSAQAQAKGPGLALALVLAVMASALVRTTHIDAYGLGSLSLAMLLGMLVGHLLPTAARHQTNAGMAFTRLWLLRCGIAGYGLKISFADLALLGWKGVLIDAIVVTGIVTLAAVAGRRVLRGDAILSGLIGIGSAVCGAAAIAAAVPVLRARESQAGVAVACVVLFGSLSMLIEPALIHGLHSAGYAFDGVQAGRYLGSTIHELAQVLAAGANLDPAVQRMAVIAKLARVLMLVPALYLLAWQQGARAVSAPRPWYAFAFVACAVLHTWLNLPAVVWDALNALVDGVLTMAMVALGVSVQITEIRRAGWAPMLLAGILWLVLTVGGLLLNGVWVSG